MNPTKHALSLLTALAVAILLAGTSAPAQASAVTEFLTSNGVSASSISSYTNSDLNSLGGTGYYVTSLYSTSASTNTVTFSSYWTGTSDSLSFSNQNLASESALQSASGEWSLTKYLYNASFYDATTGWNTYAAASDPNNVTVYKLTSPWTYHGVTLSAGTLILGLDEKPIWSNGQATADNDSYFVMVATPASSGEPSKAPIPAAVWLLGTGLIGVLGITRRRGNAC